MRCSTHGARVRAGVTGRQPDVTIGTDSGTWLRLRAGELSGIEAFSQRKLYARGDLDLDLAVGFEGLFRLPSGRPPLLRIHNVAVDGGLRISTLTMTCRASAARASPRSPATAPPTPRAPWSA